jgi:hypothetical protein
MEIRIEQLSDRELLENIFFQNILINKKLNAFIEINDELRGVLWEIEDTDFQDTTEKDIIKTTLLYKEHKLNLSEVEIIEFKKIFDREPYL